MKYKIGDCVMVDVTEKNDGELKLAAAEILETWKSKDVNGSRCKMAEVRWLYTTEEIPKQRLKTVECDPGELFETSHVDNIDMEAIQFLISVVDEDTYQEKRHTMKEINGYQTLYFSRYHYDYDMQTLRAFHKQEQGGRAQRAQLYSKRKHNSQNIEDTISSRSKRSKQSIPSVLPNPQPQVLSLKAKLERLSHHYVPDRMPCRQIERGSILSFIYQAMTQGSQNSIYISGMPGTGKTATVREVMQQLEKTSELPPFFVIEVNGMRLASPELAYPLIWQEISGERGVSPKRAGKSIPAHFLKNDPSRKFCVLVVDELDYMVTRSQQVLYNIFDWPSYAASKLIVIGIANTMDLPERLHARVASRMGKLRLVFKPYTREQVQAILMGRIGALGNMDQNAVRMIAMKIAGSSGDIRRALEICKRALLIAARKVSDSEKDAVVLEISHAQEAIKETMESPLCEAVKELGLLEKMFLIAISCELHAKGKEEAELAAVKKRYQGFCNKTFSESKQNIKELDDVCGPEFIETMLQRLVSDGIISRKQVKAYDEHFLSLHHIGSVHDIATLLQKDEVAKTYFPTEIMQYHTA